MMFIEINGEEKMIAFGKSLGALLCGGEIIELTGDIGSGKTTLVKGIAIGLGVKEYVQSPSFTISRVYKGRDDITLAHYDFYRLDDAGIMANELQEIASDSKSVVVIEWSGVVNDILPMDRISIKIISPTEISRQLDLSSGGKTSQKIVEQLTV